MAAMLNADKGWAGASGEEVTVKADEPFRLRMEILQGTDNGKILLEVRRNGGEWKLLEAHDFPYPTRELELDFSENLAVEMPDSWKFIYGSKENFGISSDSDRRYLRISGGTRGLMTVRPLPWPVSSDGSVAANIRLPRRADKVSLLWGVTDQTTYHAARFMGSGQMELLNVVAGKETILARVMTKIASGTFHEIEIDAEAGQLQIVVDGNQVFAGPFLSNLGEPGVKVTRGRGVDIEQISFEGLSRTPSVSIIASRGYANGNATSDLLKGSLSPFVPGIGVSLQETIQGTKSVGTHSEYEWPLVVRRTSDGPEVTETGDVFQFRVVSSDETVPYTGPLASVRLEVPDGHLGGTFVETPGRIGPWQASNGDLYFIMEPSETDNKFMMMKSTDGGKIWREMDSMNRPQTGDLEAVDSRLVGSRIHIVHQVTRSVRHHVFQTSDHPTAPDRWVLRDEIAATADSIAQMATMAVRSDGSIIAFFLADRLHYAVRGADGIWAPPVEIDPDTVSVNAGPQAISGKGDVVHLAYYSDDGHLWYRKMLPNGSLSERQQLASGAGTDRREYGAVLPLAYDAATDTVVIVYRLKDGKLWERRIVGTSQPTTAALVTSTSTITNAVDSQQPAADVMVIGNRPIVLFVDDTTRSLWSSSNGQNGWQSPVLRVQDIEGSWVRGNIIRKSDGSLVYGYVYDAGSKGGTGLNRYAEVIFDGE